MLRLYSVQRATNSCLRASKNSRSHTTGLTRPIIHTKGPSLRISFGDWELQLIKSREGTIPKVAALRFGIPSREPTQWEWLEAIAVSSPAISTLRWSQREALAMLLTISLNCMKAMSS